MFELVEGDAGVVPSESSPKGLAEGSKEAGRREEDEEEVDLQTLLLRLQEADEELEAAKRAQPPVAVPEVEVEEQYKPAPPTLSGPLGAMTIRAWVHEPRADGWRAHTVTFDTVTRVLLLVELEVCVHHRSPSHLGTQRLNRVVLSR
jgi:hypothetical protein